MELWGQGPCAFHAAGGEGGPGRRHQLGADRGGRKRLDTGGGERATDSWALATVPGFKPVLTK
jgi:hypothetical protein